MNRRSYLIWAVLVPLAAGCSETKEALPDTGNIVQRDMGASSDATAINEQNTMAKRLPCAVGLTPAATTAACCSST